MAKSKRKRTSKTDAATIAKIRRLKKTGATAGEIAKACNTSPSTVYAYTKTKKAARRQPGATVDQMNEALVASAAGSNSIQEILEAAARLNLQIIIINGRAN